MADIYETHYPAIRNMIINGLMYEKIRYAIKQAVTMVMMDAIKRSDEDCYEGSQDAYNEAVIGCSEVNMESMQIYAFEKIMDSIGNGSLKRGIHDLITHANSIGWEYGRSNGTSYKS